MNMHGCLRRGSGSPVKLLRRADLVLRRDATLGTIMSDLAAVHGSRRLVEEAEGGLRISYRQADKRVNRWAGGIASKVEHGDRVVIATPNSYEMFLLCLAVARAGAIPVPLNDRMRPDEVAHVVRDSGAALDHPQRDRGRRLRAAERSRAGEPRRHRGVVLHVGHDGQTEGRRAHPSSVRRQHLGRRGVAGPAASRRGRVQSADRAHHGLHRVDGLRVCGHPRVPDPELPADRGARCHRAAAGHGVHRRAGDVSSDARSRCRGSRPHVGAGLGLGRRCHAAGGRRAASSRWAHRSPCPSSGPWARPCSPRVTAWSRRPAVSRPRSRRRCSAWGSGTRSA